jgi:hypothetical protein
MPVQPYKLLYILSHFCIPPARNAYLARGIDSQVVFAESLTVYAILLLQFVAFRHIIKQAMYVVWVPSIAYRRLRLFELVNPPCLHISFFSRPSIFEASFQWAG